jgi:peptide/nickel transport system substrate-binding protein
MSRKIWLALAAALLGAGLLVAAATAAPNAKSSSAAASAAHAKKGGTVVIELDSDIDYNDPQLTYYTPSWQLQYAAACKLFNWPDKEGAAGGAVTPEVSAGLPIVSNNGKTYTFTIKPGFRFSNGQAVNALSFKNAWERLANPKMASQGSPFLDIVAGAQAVIDGKASSISGVKANGNKLSVTLTKAAPDFLARLTMPFFQAIDTNLAKTIDPAGVQTFASCGPYYYSAYTPNRSITLKRNPYYKGSRPANPDTIQVNVGNSLETIYQNTLTNKTDYGAAIPPAQWAGIAKSFPVNTKDGRYQTRPELVIDYVALNHDRPLFKNNPQLAKAVNWAVDRQAYVAQRGFQAGKRADQILPPGMAGFKDEALYPLKVTVGSIAKAKKLAAGNTRDGKAVIWTSNRGAAPLQAQVVQFNLKNIGIDSEIKLLPRAQQFGTAKIRAQATYDITLEAWGADYNDPYDFLNILLDGSQIDSTGNNNYAYYNNPKFNKQMQQASLLGGAARGAAYQVLDKQMMTQDPPWAPTNYRNDRVFLSNRFGCVIVNEAASPGPDLAALCLK